VGGKRSFSMRAHVRYTSKRRRRIPRRRIDLYMYISPFRFFHFRLLPS
jgi:hypothetical protein